MGIEDEQPRSEEERRAAEQFQAADDTREQFEQEQGFRSDERNKYRTVWQKMFGGGKSTGMDMAIEEALKMDAAIEKELQEGHAETIEEALNSVDQLPEFQLKGTEWVGKEEYARAKTLQVGKAIESNKFYEAVSVLHNEQRRKSVDRETAQVMNERTTTLVKEHVTSLAQSKDGKNFVSAIYWFSSRIKPEDLPSDAVNSPEITGAVRDHAVSWLKSFHYEGDVGKEWEKFYRLGLLNREDIVQDPEVRQFAEQKATSYFHTFHYEPETYMKIRDNFVQLGIGTAQEYNQLPEIQQYAKEKAISYFRTFSYDPNCYLGLWKGYERAGILPVDQIKELPEIAERPSR